MKNRIMGIAALILFILVFAPSMVWLWQRWTMSIWHNGHGLFVPLIVAYLVYQALKSDESKQEESSAWGFVFFIPGLLLVIIDSAIKTQLLSAMGLTFCLIGLVLLFFGLRRTKTLAFPLLLLFLMLPIPTAFIDRFVLLLRRMSATGCESLLMMAGMPVLREFTTIRLPSGVLEIADACSGFSTLYASVTMALILAYLNSSNGRRIMILLACIPLAIGCNIFRCTLLAYLVHNHGSEVLATQLHPFTGVFSFTLALSLLFAISWLGTRKEHSVDTSVDSLPASHSNGTSADTDSSRSSLLQ